MIPTREIWGITKPLPNQRGIPFNPESSDIATRPRQADSEPERYRIFVGRGHHNRNRACGITDGQDRRLRTRNDSGGLERGQLGCEFRDTSEVSLRISEVNDNVSTFHIAKIVKSRAKGFNVPCRSRG
jgi:hypothetical protein